MEPFSELEKHYEVTDPWKYQSNRDDILRRQIILGIADAFAPRGSQFDRALDIGAGEGWITSQLPAFEIFGYEASDNAAARFPRHIQRVTDFVAADRDFDLVCATGIMYAHYAWPTFIQLIKMYSSNIVLTCNIKDWEVPAVKDIGKQVFEAEFPYREFTQKLRVFKVR